MTAYYNENDPYCAEWLRNLIGAGHIAPGDVDERDMREVRAEDVRGYVQVHWCAGIGIWSAALRRAGWADDRPAWTASLPCQPFSAAGKRKGFADERHLWPVLLDRVRERRPLVCFGEQIADGDGPAWINLVSTDLEGAGYRVGPTNTPACGFGAPHIRQRCYWVADASGPGTRQCALAIREGQTDGDHNESRLRDVLESGSATGGVADGDRSRCGTRRAGEAGDGPNPAWIEPSGLRSTGGFWSSADWLPCRDGKWRPAGRGIHPLAIPESRSQCVANGHPSRVDVLRALGNALVAPQAEAFVRAYMDRDQVVGR